MQRIPIATSGGTARRAVLLSGRSCTLVSHKVLGGSRLGHTRFVAAGVKEQPTLLTAMGE
jgi:hypothetical protein